MAEGVATSVAGKVVDLLFGVAKKEISYMWNCTKNVEKLKNEAEKLKVTRGKVQQQIDIARSKGENLLYGVQVWLDKADVEIFKVDEFLEEEANAKKTCFRLGLCGNWNTLYHYGKVATKKALSLLQHQEDGKIYERCVSVDTPTPGRLDVYQNKNLDDILTQNSALGDIITAIEDDSIQIIGIYGVGGVGKTTLAMEVVARVKNLFAAVAFTTVSQTVDSNKIQNDIREETKRVMNGEKVLIILDDAWEELKLDEVGIPCGIEHMNCKILLTSRNKDVCVAMNVQSKICVCSLPIDEAWVLFKHVVGERVEKNSHLKRVAMEVAEECGGLPLIIKAVGNALKNKNISSWEATLARLKNHAPLDISPEIRKAFTHLKLSYDYLESEEARSCFLLCSMFPEDATIRLERLAHYGVGLAKFNDLESMDDARDRVRIAVNILKSSNLLLNEKNIFTTKMHDVVRDVALLITSKGKEIFLVKAGKGLKEWQPRNNGSEGYTGISLMKNKIHKLPDYKLHFPHLKTLLLQENYNLSVIPDEFILGIKEARVLDLADARILSLPQSFELLTKLRMLNLGGNEFLCEISILGELKDLEILILNETGIEEIPQEIGQLARLRRLEVNHCKRLSHISPGVISMLRWLEELCIGFYSTHKGIYDNLVEVMNLSKLTYLDLFVLSFDVIPESFNSGKLKGFMIQIGGGIYFFPDRWVLNSKRYLILGTRYLKIPFMKWSKKLIEGSPDLFLRSIENLNNILPSLYDEGFNNLESIRLWECNNVSCVVDTRHWDHLKLTLHSSKDIDEGKTQEIFFTKLKHLGLTWLSSLEVLWNCPDQYINLSNLVTLDISFCDKLVRVFSLGVAQGLVNLQKLRIGHSSALEEVIWGGDEETNIRETVMVEHTANIIVFPCLANICFENLPILKSLYSQHSTIKYPALVEANIRCCTNMTIWGYGIHYTPKLKFVNHVPVDGPYAINDAVAKSYKNDQAQYLGYSSL